VSSPAPRIRQTLGIDLGTTNSVIALLDAPATRLITGRDDHGRMTFPSLVGYDPARAALVAGRDALPLSRTGAPGADATGLARADATGLALPLASVKRFMGLEKRFAVGPHSLSAPEASALILRHLRDQMARTLADPAYLLDSAIITMPAYFNHNQIEATRAAGELAGFEVVELLHEPTAAAIYYSWLENHDDATYLVYDLGGGTFDVSVIRRRLGDYEVLAVSGDPFLGGDDFDRALASHLLQTAAWRWQDGGRADPAELSSLFDPTTPAGAGPFARLVSVAEAIKTQLAGTERVQRYVPSLACPDGRSLSLEAEVSLADFERLIKEKVERTIACCHEALARARDRAGVRLGDVDHVILVGGSSRAPLVRRTVAEAFCKANLPEHARHSQPLLHEPDLCVAYGAALRAASCGTRYQWGMGNGEWGMTAGTLQLHLTSPGTSREPLYHATGIVSVLPSTAGRSSFPIPHSPFPILDGGSVRVRSLATGLSEECFLDERGTFGQDVELNPEADNRLEWAVCDGAGRELAKVVTTVRHGRGGPALGHGVLATQLIVKPLQIEVLTRGRQRIKQVVAAVGAALPGTFECVCRTQDQTGRIILPIYEEDRVIKQLVIADLPTDLDVGTPVEVRFTIDTRHEIQVEVRIRQGAEGADRIERATIEAPPPQTGQPTRAEIEEVCTRIEQRLGELVGASRSRHRSRLAQVRQDLLEALSYDDEPRSIQRMAELRGLLQQLESGLGSVLDPPWPRFTQLVRQCLDLAAEVAGQTRRDAQELFEHVHTQERYAEQAHEEGNQALYRECWDNLDKYSGYLTQLLRDTLPRPPRRLLSPEEEAREEVERFRGYLGQVWKQARAKGRADLEAQLAEIASQAQGFTPRIKSEPEAVLRDARRLGAEVARVEGQLEAPPRPAGDQAGLLEGSP
jgi:molecular chaperone DnaK